MVEVFLDTNFLLLPGQSGIDVFSGVRDVLDVPFEFVVLDCVLAELESLASSSGVAGSAARLGLSLVKRKPLKIVSCSTVKHVDDAILGFVGRGVYVATLDRDLQKRVLAKGGLVIGVRNFKVVVLGD